MNKVMTNPMNSLQFEPWTVADLLRRDLGRVTSRRSNTGTTAVWSPATDIVEKDDRFEIQTDLPGVSAADVDVSMDAGVLIISGERKAADRDENDSVQRIERVSGRFTRRFSLPDTANADAIKARMSNGILEVAIPKLPEPKARRITVETA